MDWLIGHLVGDYLLQNDWMAMNKKTHTLHCAVHCAIYTAVVTLFTGWYGWPMAVVFSTHFAQDRTNVIRWWMHTIGQDRFATGPCSPWSIIVVDNVFHLLVLWAIWHHSDAC